MRCDHSGAHSGATRYVKQVGRLRMILVCDECGAELSEVGVLDYQPDPSLPGPPASTSIPPSGPLAA